MSETDNVNALIDELLKTPGLKSMVDNRAIPDKFKVAIEVGFLRQLRKIVSEEQS